MGPVDQVTAAAAAHNSCPRAEGRRAARAAYSSPHDNPGAAFRDGRAVGTVMQVHAGEVEVTT